jgi:hypothetical protein
VSDPLAVFLISFFAGVAGVLAFLWFDRRSR